MTPCQPHCIEVPCDCKETLHIRRIGLDGYKLRHGDNPEHTSRIFRNRGMFLHETREWRTAVHDRMVTS